MVVEMVVRAGLTKEIILQEMVVVEVAGIRATGEMVLMITGEMVAQALVAEVAVELSRSNRWVV